jgi:predicted DNA-binding transcriptional regulator AlpA
MSDFITPQEVAELTGYSKGVLSNMRMKKEGFPFYKMGKKVFYKESEVLKAIEDTKVETASKAS